MESYHEKIKVLIINIKQHPKDIVGYNQLWKWGVELAAHLMFLGQEEIKAKHEYWRVLSDIRKETRSKADAEIRANSTEEAHKYWQLKALHDDGKEMLLVIKKFFDVLNDERKISGDT